MGGARATRPAQRRGLPRSRDGRLAQGRHARGDGAAELGGRRGVCGIAGIWGADDPVLVRRMTDALAHRGPDGSGFHRQSTATLGHRRLAIMDPAGGAQPLYGETPARAIVANGEIFNYPLLRGELADRHAFRTGSDIEAVLHLYEEQGPRGVDALGGMFAIAICDEDHLFLARDPIGIKPLYYGHGRTADGSAVLAFASEMRAL